MINTFYIQTIGCQMNDHDSATLSGLLIKEGYTLVDQAKQADLILLNTCAIREKAEQKVYSQLGRYKQLKQARPGLILGVGGCMAQGEGRRVLSRAPYVDLVFGTQTMHRVPEMVRKVEAERRRSVSIEMDNAPENMEALYAHSRGDGPKAFITVMQGCDNYCAYCVVPYVRGRELSRSGAEIVAEAKRLAGEGVREITLLGQNVNSYGLKGGDGTDFPALIRKVAEIDGIARIRFTTSHPKDLSDELIALFDPETGEPTLMPHIHLPVQSGSDAVLEAMNRRYTVSHYLSLIDKLRDVNPEIAISSDMIVGFPGETEEDFQATLAVMDRVRFDGLFSFKFSPRRDTKAAEMGGELEEPVKEQRLAVLQGKQKEHTLERNRAWIGRAVELMVEGESKAGGQRMGRTPQGKIVNFAAPVDETLEPGTMLRVKVVDAYINAMTGEASF